MYDSQKLHLVMRGITGPKSFLKQAAWLSFSAKTEVILLYDNVCNGCLFSFYE